VTLYVRSLAIIEGAREGESRPKWRGGTGDRGRLEDRRRDRKVGQGDPDGQHQAGL